MEDRRYHTVRWRRSREAALARDKWTCRIVEGCPRKATVADHIMPVYPGMPDHEFFAMSNLRAGCHTHNTRRGMAERLEREMREGVQPLAPLVAFASRSRFLGARTHMTGPLPKSLPLSRTPTVFRGTRGGYGADRG
jgi:hypothetical protein